MTNIELALNQLAEVSATAIAQAKNPKGYSETKSTVVEGGTTPNAMKYKEGTYEDEYKMVKVFEKTLC